MKLQIDKSTTALPADRGTNPGADHLRGNSGGLPVPIRTPAGGGAGRKPHHGAERL